MERRNSKAKGRKRRRAMRGKTALAMVFLLFFILAGIVVAKTSVFPDRSQGEKVLDETAGAQGSAADQGEKEDPSGSGAETGGDEAAKEESEEKYDAELAVKEIEGIPMISLNELSRETESPLLYEETDGTIQLTYQGNEVRLLKGSPTIAVNGIFYPLEKAPVISQSEIAVPAASLEWIAGAENIKVVDNQTVRIKLEKGSAPAAAAPRGFDLAAASEEDLIQYLSFLQVPIEHAHVSTRDSHLPGAPRAYRNGVHEGLDWYGGFTGTRIEMMTPVLASAKGRVVRADHDYVEMSVAERERYLQIAKNNPRTPEWILDKMRGRQLWVQSENGVLLRYAHLAKIADGIKPGTEVEPGQLIAYVGNSGTSNGARKTKADAHLHLDILIYGEPFWSHLDQKEIRAVLEGVFNR